jgi:hypothetical protein
MNRMLYVALLTAPLLTACIVEPANRGPGFIVAPALPLIVELGAEPYYYQSGYHYYYHNDRWSYSNARTGPWIDLPRDRYPREIRYRDHSDGRGRGPDSHDRGPGGQDGGHGHNYP